MVGDVLLTVPTWLKQFGVRLPVHPNFIMQTSVKNIPISSGYVSEFSPTCCHYVVGIVWGSVCRAPHFVLQTSTKLFRFYPSTYRNFLLLVASFKFPSVYRGKNPPARPKTFPRDRTECEGLFFARRMTGFEFLRNFVV